MIDKIPRNNVASVHHLPYLPHPTDKLIALVTFAILVWFLSPIQELAVFKYITSKVKIK